MDEKFLKEMFERHHANDGGFCRHYMTLYSIILGMEAKKVLEFGSGFSSKIILNALCKTNGELYTLDMRSFEETSHQYNFNEEEKEAYLPRWKYFQGKSHRTRRKVSEMLFDVVLHDGSHKCDYVKLELDFVIPRVRNGGVILVHDTNHPTLNYNLDKAVEPFKSDHDVCTLPYGYGLTLITVNNDNPSVDISWRKE